MSSNNNQEIKNRLRKQTIAQRPHRFQLRSKGPPIAAPPPKRTKKEDTAVVTPVDPVTEVVPSVRTPTSVAFSPVPPRLAPPNYEQLIIYESHLADWRFYCSAFPPINQGPVTLTSPRIFGNAVIAGTVRTVTEYPPYYDDHYFYQYNSGRLAPVVPTNTRPLHRSDSGSSFDC